MVGGMHTSGYLLVWVMHYLTLHPVIMDTLLLEIKEIDTGSHDKQFRDYVFSDKTLVRSHTVIVMCVSVASIAH